MSTISQQNATGTEGASTPIPPGPQARFEMPGLRYPAMPRSTPDPEILPIEAARAETHAAVHSALATAEHWLAEANATTTDEEDGTTVPDRQRRDAAGPAPRALIQITPGCGKTSAAKAALAQREQLAVTVTPLAAEADGYAGAIRRRPRADAPNEKNHCMMLAGQITVQGKTIPIRGVNSPLGGNVIQDTPHQEHRTSDTCRSDKCPKAASRDIKNPASRLTPCEKKDIQKKLDECYSKEAQAAIDEQPCFIYDEIPHALRTPTTAVTALGFSDSDAQFKDEDGALNKKQILIDELQMSAMGHIHLLSAVDLTSALEDITSWKSRIQLEIADLYRQNAERQAIKSEKFAAYRENRLQELEDDLYEANYWVPSIIVLRNDIEDLAQNGGFARRPQEHTETCIRETVETAELHECNGWEKPVWQRLEKMIRLPLRLLKPAIQGVMEGSAVVTPDGLQVLYERPLLRHILDRKHPVTITDGNPSPTIKAFCNHDQDSATVICRIVAEQHVNIRIDHRFTHGVPAPAQRSDAVDRKEGQEIADTAARLSGDRPMFILANKYRAEAVKSIIAADNNGDPPYMNAGHWGRHNRATNDFAGHDVMVWDDPAFPREAQMDAWRLHRAILIRSGIRKPEELPIGDFSETAYRERAFYRIGDADMQNPAREHHDPEIRAFLRELQFNEKWQGLCRARGVNADPDSPLQIHLCGGMAMDRLHEQGIRDSQITFHHLVNKKSHGERCREQMAAADGRAWAAATAVGAAGGTITRAAINDHLRSAGEAGISNTVYRRVTGDPAWADRFSEQAARTGRGAVAMKAQKKLVDTCRTAGRPDLVEAAAKEAFEAVERSGGDTSRIIEYAHRVMAPGKEHLEHNLAGWLLIDTCGATDTDRHAPAFPQAPPAAA